MCNPCTIAQSQQSIIKIKDIFVRLAPDKTTDTRDCSIYASYRLTIVSCQTEALAPIIRAFNINWTSLSRLWIVADLILLAILVTAARNLFQKAAQLFQNVTFQLFKFSKKFHPNYHVLSKPGLLFFFTQKKMTKLSTSHIFRLIIILWVLSAAAAVPFAVFTKVNYFR